MIATGVPRPAAQQSDCLLLSWWCLPHLEGRKVQAKTITEPKLCMSAWIKMSCLEAAIGVTRLQADDFVAWLHSRHQSARPGLFEGHFLIAERLTAARTWVSSLTHAADPFFRALVQNRDLRDSEAVQERQEVEFPLTPARRSTAGNVRKGYCIQVASLGKL